MNSTTNPARPAQSARLLILMLAAIVFGGLLVAGCGGDDSTTSTESTSTDSSSTESSSTTSTSASTGDTVQGDGYSYPVPDGWTVAQQSGSGSGGIDTVITSDAASSDFQVNINVVRENDIPDNVEISQYVDAGLKQIQGDPSSFGLPADSTVELQGDPTPGTLAGDDSLDYEILTKGQGIAASQRQVAAIHDGTAYTITLSAAENELDAENPTLDEIVSGWSWS